MHSPEFASALHRFRSGPQHRINRFDLRLKPFVSFMPKDSLLPGPLLTG